MTGTSEGQVGLTNLLFTMSWEDPVSDRQALSIQPGDTVMTVTSGGCNTLGMLLLDPSSVFAVDINPAQSCLLELKMAAIRHLELNECLAFLGVRHSIERIRYFDKIRESLSPGSRAYWGRHLQQIKGGVLGTGRFERFVGMFRLILRMLQGRPRISGLFDAKSVEDQRRYYDEVWNTRRYQMLFKVFFNRFVLAHQGLSADYFKFDDGATSFAESFSLRARRALRDLPVQGNYFVAQYLLGGYRSESELPDYLLPENYETIRQRLDRIVVVTKDAKVWLEEQTPHAIDCFSLSNICELMSLEETSRTFHALAHAGRNGARVCFRNLMVPREVPPALTERVRRDDSLSERLRSHDRSFVYSRVDALRIVA